LFKTLRKSLKALFMHISKGGENAQLIRLYANRISLYTTLGSW